MMDLTNRSKPFIFLAGIVSFGPRPCGSNEWPGVYTVPYIFFLNYFLFSYKTRNEKFEKSFIDLVFFFRELTVILIGYWIICGHRIELNQMMDFCIIILELHNF